jgi:hypothetical protein
LKATDHNGYEQIIRPSREMGAGLKSPMSRLANLLEIGLMVLPSLYTFRRRNNEGIPADPREIRDDY